jgi:hypothetical protein
MRPSRLEPFTKDGISRFAEIEGSSLSSVRCPTADAIRMVRPRSVLRSPGALLITVLAVTDVAYRLLLREPVRRALGMRR